MTSQGEAIIRYTMTNERGSSAQITNLGAAIIGINVPDRTGKIDDVVLGYSTAEDYLNDRQALGKCLGRVAGCIAQGRLTISGEEIQLERNEGRHHVHGGKNGFSERLWESRVETNRVVMSIVSEDGEGGYPAEVACEIAFDFTEEDALEITYLAKASATTALNLTHRIFWNLDGASSESIWAHELRMHADKAFEINAHQIASGVIFDTQGTPQDFGEFCAIGTHRNEAFNQIDELGGFAHPYLISDWQENILGKVAELRSQQSGRKVEILSSQRSVLLDTGNLLSGEGIPSKNGTELKDNQGVALQPMNIVTSSPSTHLPSIELRPEECYCQKTVYRFSTFEAN